MAEALKRARKPFEFLVIENGGHGFTGDDSIRSWQKAMEFLTAHLGARRPERRSQ